MADNSQSWISALIEALRGGNNPNGPPAFQYPSTYNPPAKSTNPSQGLSAGMRDPDYQKYLKTYPAKPKDYMRWLEEGE